MVSAKVVMTYKISFDHPAVQNAGKWARIASGRPSEETISDWAENHFKCKFHFTWWEPSQMGNLEFENEQDALAFLLRWS